MNGLFPSDEATQLALNFLLEDPQLLLIPESIHVNPAINLQNNDPTTVTSELQVNEFHQSKNEDFESVSSYPEVAANYLPNMPSETVNKSEPSLESVTSENISSENISNKTSDFSLHRWNSSTLKDHMLEYNKLVPVFKKIEGKTFAKILVSVLRKCLFHISLDDFFNMLYNSNSMGDVVSLPDDGNKIHQNEPSESRTEAIKLCRLVIETFRLRSILGGENGPLPLVNLQRLVLTRTEFLRVFLALKIIFDAVKVIDDPSSSDGSLPRISIYKAYCIVCRRLMQKYPRDSNSSKNCIILNQSQIGRIFRLIFPNLSSKRRGKLKGSIHYYQGIEWDPLLINDEIKRLVNLSLLDLESNFKNAPPQKHIKLDSYLVAGENVALFSSGFIPNSGLLSLSLAGKKPLYSFVDLSNTFTIPNCFLRLWQNVPGKIPQQSQWSKDTMHRSLEALKSYNVDVESLIFNLRKENFSAKSVDTFLWNIHIKIRFLMENLACEDVYLHLYLVVSLLIFPVASVSETQMKLNSKDQLQASLTKFVTSLEVDIPGLSLFNVNNLMSFSKIVRKMISFNKLILSRVTTSLTKSIFRIIGGDPRLASDPEMVKTIEEGMVTIIQRAIITACHAFNWKFVDEGLRGNLQYRAELIHKITERYMIFSITLVMRVWEIQESMTSADLAQKTYELPLKLFWQLTQIFHEVFLSDPLILLLPIKLVELLIINVTNDFQTECFHGLRNLNRELSKEVFKTYWVYTTAIHDYISILSEIVALNMRLC